MGEVPRDDWISFTVKMVPRVSLEVWANNSYKKVSAKGRRPAKAFGMCSSGSFEFSSG